MTYAIVVGAVLVIAVTGMFFTISTTMFLLNLQSQTQSILKGDTSASRQMGQGIRDEVSSDVSWTIGLEILIAVCAAVGIPIVIIVALRDSR